MHDDVPQATNIQMMSIDSNMHGRPLDHGRQLTFGVKLPHVSVLIAGPLHHLSSVAGRSHAHARAPKFKVVATAHELAGTTRLGGDVQDLTLTPSCHSLRHVRLLLRGLIQNLNGGLI